MHCQPSETSAPGSLGRSTPCRGRLPGTSRSWVRWTRPSLFLIPAYRVGSIRPIVSRKRANLFKMGQLGLDHPVGPETGWQARCRYALPSSPPSAVSIGQDKSANRLLRGTVSANLNYLARRGRILKSGGRRSARWELPKEML